MEPLLPPNTTLSKYAVEPRPLASVTSQGALAKGLKDLQGHLFLASSLSEKASTQRVNI